MKITFGILTLCKGGAQRMLAELVNGLAQRGHQVEVVMPAKGVVEYQVQAKITRTRHGTIKATDYPQSDVIVSNYYTLVPEAQLASEQGKGKHVRISLCYEPLLMPDQAKTFTSYQYTPHLVVLSNWQKQLLQLNHGIEGQIVPVGVSAAFNNVNQTPSNGLHIGAIIRRPEDPNWHRQQDYLIEVLTNIKNKYPHVNIHCMTPPNEFRTSRKLKSWKQQKDFQFHLPPNDQVLNNLYNQLDIFVNTSIYDTASLPGLEAMKCGATLVTTYNGGNADYAVNNVNCLLSYRFENRLEADVERLIRNPTLRNRLARAGEKEAAKWTWSRSVNIFERYLNILICD